MAKDYNDQDVKFVQMMIPHHQKAVSEAATEYARGENKQIKEMALAIYSGQKEEIAKFQKWLKDRGIAEKPPGKM